MDRITLAVAIGSFSVGAVFGAAVMVLSLSFARIRGAARAVADLEVERFGGYRPRGSAKIPPVPVAGSAVVR